MEKNNKALARLSQDPIMKKLIQEHELPGWEYEGALVYELIDAIIGQQLSVKAGRAIKNKFYALFDTERPDLAKILKKTDDELRAVGLSYAKAKYVKSVCEHALSGDVDFEGMRNLPDEEIIAELIKIKGVGRWTAEMFIMFSLNRPDVFS